MLGFPQFLRHTDSLPIRLPLLRTYDPVPRSCKKNSTIYSTFPEDVCAPKRKNMVYLYSIVRTIRLLAPANIRCRSDASSPTLFQARRRYLNQFRTARQSDCPFRVRQFRRRSPLSGGSRTPFRCVRAESDRVNDPCVCRSHPIAHQSWGGTFQEWAIS